MKLCIRLGIIGLVIAVCIPTIAISFEYKLGPEDRLRLMVYEWRPSRGETYSWVPLNADFTVGPGGFLSLPFVGNVKAEGATAEELAALISTEVQKKLGLLERPSASVEVVKFRPFYIVGDVANPGEYSYRPDLTVQKAISLAGGIYRPTGNSASSLQRDSLVSRGELKVMENEYLGLVAKSTRLKAEASNASKIDFPAELASKISDKYYSELLAEERSIFDSRRNAVRSKIENLNEGKRLLTKEIETLNLKDVSAERQLSLAVSERNNVKSLSDKGLVVSNRQIATEQNVSQIETVRLDIGIARVRAEQDRAKLERDVLDLQDQRRGEILIELRQVGAKIDELNIRMATSERLVANSEGLSSDVDVAASSDLTVPTIKLSITKKLLSKSSEMIADLNMVVDPGDIVKIRREMPTSLRNSNAYSVEVKSGNAKVDNLKVPTR